MKSVKTSFWLLTLCLLTCCQTVQIPKAYQVKPARQKYNLYGCWMKMEYCQKPDTVVRKTEGELICMGSDTLYLLSKDSCLSRIAAGDISKACLITHRNLSNVYARTTGLFLVPNLVGALATAGTSLGIFASTVYVDTAVGFLALGVPVILVGVPLIIIEFAAKRNMLRYPQKATLEQINQFARFPAGRPPGIDLDLLLLSRGNQYEKKEIPDQPRIRPKKDTQTENKP